MRDSVVKISGHYCLCCGTKHATVAIQCFWELITVSRGNLDWKLPFGQFLFNCIVFLSAQPKPSKMANSWYLSQLTVLTRGMGLGLYALHLFQTLPLTAVVLVKIKGRGHWFWWSIWLLVVTKLVKRTQDSPTEDTMASPILLRGQCHSLYWVNKEICKSQFCSTKIWHLFVLSLYPIYAPKDFPWGKIVKKKIANKFEGKISRNWK